MILCNLTREAHEKHSAKTGASISSAPELATLKYAKNHPAVFELACLLSPKSKRVFVRLRGGLFDPLASLCSVSTGSVYFSLACSQTTGQLATNVLGQLKRLMRPRLIMTPRPPREGHRDRLSGRLLLSLIPRLIQQIGPGTDSAVRYPQRKV